jgi:group II intron reverse transcriptase/maturase
MNNVTEEMNHLHALARRDPSKRFNHLWKNLTDPRWLGQAWEQIRRNRGSQTAGVDRMTAVDVDLLRIRQWIEALKTGRYKPTPVRRVYLEKSNGQQRPLGIPTIKDRVIQQGLKLLLEPIFEADFRHCSHGFRPGRSPHTALRAVARTFPATGWTIEGDITGCFDNIPHTKLMAIISKRISDGKVLNLIRAFLKAGYLEDWRFHRTYSGTPQGGILSPLLANIFLHQLDEFVEDDLKANRVQSIKERNARRHPEYMRISHQLVPLRKRLVSVDAEGRKNLLVEIRQLERQRQQLPSYDKNKPHPCRIKYVRYADDFVVMVAGAKAEAETVKDEIRHKLSSLGLLLNEEKTRLTHWSKPIRFLSYEIKGKLRAKGVGVKAVLIIPYKNYRQTEMTLGRICGYHHIPEADAMAQASAVFRGWCNYYRYANSPQMVFNRLAYKLWWHYAHYLARKTKTRSIKQLIVREKKAGRLSVVERGDRRRQTFQTLVGSKRIILNLFPPQTGRILSLPNEQVWQADLRPVTPLSWQSGRSLATRLEAIERAKGVCERCHTHPVEQVHHTIPLRKTARVARVKADSNQRYTALALCRKCHLKLHGGSFNRSRSNRNAGYIERCSPSVGSAG